MLAPWENIQESAPKAPWETQEIAEPVKSVAPWETPISNQAPWEKKEKQSLGQKIGGLAIGTFKAILGTLENIRYVPEAQLKQLIGAYNPDNEKAFDVLVKSGVNPRTAADSVMKSNITPLVQAMPEDARAVLAGYQAGKFLRSQEKTALESFNVSEDSPAYKVSRFWSEMGTYKYIGTLVNKVLPFLKLSDIPYDAPMLQKLEIHSLNVAKSMAVGAPIGGIAGAAYNYEPLKEGVIDTEEFSRRIWGSAALTGIFMGGMQVFGEIGSELGVKKFAGKVKEVQIAQQKRNETIKQAVTNHKKDIATGISRQDAQLGLPLKEQEVERVSRAGWDSLSGKAKVFPKDQVGYILPYKPDFSGLSAKELSMLYNGLDNRPFHAATRLALAREKLGIPEKEFDTFVSMILGKGKIGKPYPTLLEDYNKVDRAIKAFIQVAPSQLKDQLKNGKIPWTDEKVIGWASKWLSKTNWEPESFEKMLLTKSFIPGRELYRRLGAEEVAQKIDVTNQKLLHIRLKYSQTRNNMVKNIQKEAKIRAKQLGIVGINPANVEQTAYRKIQQALEGQRQVTTLTKAEHAYFKFFDRLRSHWAKEFNLKEADNFTQNYFSHVIKNVSDVDAKLQMEASKLGIWDLVSNEDIHLMNELKQSVNYLKRRTKNLTPGQYETNADRVMGLYNEAMANLSRRRQIIEYNREFQVRHPEIAAAGKETVEIINRMVKEAVYNVTEGEAKLNKQIAANPWIKKLFHLQEGENYARRISSSITKYFSVAFLGANRAPSYVARNYTQLILPMTYVEPKYIGRAVKNTIARGFKVSALVRETSITSHLYREGGTKYLQYLTGENAADYMANKTLGQKLQSAWMWHVGASGRNIANITIDAAYMQAKAKGLPDWAAMAHADYVAKQTQFLYTFTNKSLFARDSSGRVLSLFSSWPINGLNYLKHAAGDVGLMRLGRALLVAEAVGAYGSQMDSLFEQSRSSRWIMRALQPFFILPYELFIDLVDALDSYDLKKIERAVRNIGYRSSPSFMRNMFKKNKVSNKDLFEYATQVAMHERRYFEPSNPMETVANQLGEEIRLASGPIHDGGGPAIGSA